MKFIPHCRGKLRIGKINMKLQNLIHIAIGIACIGLLPAAPAVVPPSDGANTAEGQNRVTGASPFAEGAATHETRVDSQGCTAVFQTQAKSRKLNLCHQRHRRKAALSASWDNVAGAAGYLLDVSTSGSFSDYVDGYHDLDVGNVREQVVTDLMSRYHLLLPSTRLYCHWAGQLLGSNDGYDGACHRANFRRYGYVAGRN